MPHYPGHLPDGSLVIEDTLIGKIFHVHGYLFVDKPKKTKNGINTEDGVPDENMRILFLNNTQMPMPENVNSKGTLIGLSPDEVKARKIGFNLLLIDMPKVKNGDKSKWGIAYNLAKWDDHENTEKCVKEVKRFKGKRLEDIDPGDILALASQMESDFGEGAVVNNGLSKGSTGREMAVSILKQSAEYMRTESFKLSRAENYYDWIKSNVADFEQMAELFGSYTPKKVAKKKK